MTGTVLALERFHQELPSMAKHSFDEGHDYLNDSEIVHLIKMTNDVVAKIKKQTREINW